MLKFALVAAALAGIAVASPAFSVDCLAAAPAPQAGAAASPTWPVAPPQTQDGHEPQPVSAVVGQGWG
jgi:hypothetical protein